MAFSVKAYGFLGPFVVLSGNEGSTTEKSYCGNSLDMMSRGVPVSQGLSAFSCQFASGMTVMRLH